LILGKNTLKKLHIALILSGDEEIGGGFQQQLTTILELKKLNNYKFIVFVFSKKNVSKLQAHNIEPIFIKKWFYEKGLMYLLRQNWAFYFVEKYKIMPPFEKILVKYDIDLVYFLSPNKLAIDLVKINYMTTVWDLSHRDTPEFPEVRAFRKFEGREILYTQALKKSIGIITDSNKGKINIIKRYGIDKNRVYAVSYLPSQNAINTNIVDVKKKYCIGDNYIYYPAQFWSHKNHIYILDAIKLLLKDNINLKAVFSGSNQGNLNYVLEYAKNIGVRNHIEYLGYVPGEDIYSLYKQALALVMPTYFGPTNIPPLEAFAIGVPVIYSDLPDLMERVDGAVLYCDLNNPESLANHIKSLLKSKDLSTSLIEKGKQRLNELQKINITIVVEKILDEYAIKLKSWKDYHRN
jgi:glycosyltransferase involved in cell wall biosynthesis